MPVPAALAPFIPAIIGGVASLAGGAINAIGQGRQNRKSREWSQQMYDLQKQDNIAYWNMQNDYNNPQSQMQRFQSAGLNPLLIYGRGDAGNAGPVGTPDVQQAQFRNPEFGNAVQGAGASFIENFQNWEVKQAQVDNVRADTTTKLSQALLNSTSRERGEFDLGVERELRDVSLDARREMLRQAKAVTQFRLNEDERRTALNASNLREAAERILASRVGRDKARAQIKNTNLDSELKRLDRNLRRIGISWQDPLPLRIMGRLIGPIDQRIKNQVKKNYPNKNWRDVIWEENFLDSVVR
jgi:hypothetical protein